MRRAWRRLHTDPCLGRLTCCFTTSLYLHHPPKTDRLFSSVFGRHNQTWCSHQHQWYIADRAEWSQSGGQLRSVARHEISVWLAVSAQADISGLNIMHNSAACLNYRLYRGWGCLGLPTTNGSEWRRYQYSVRLAPHLGAMGITLSSPPPVCRPKHTIYGCYHC